MILWKSETYDAADVRDKVAAGYHIEDPEKIQGFNGYFGFTFGDVYISEDLSDILKNDPSLEREIVAAMDRFRSFDYGDASKDEKELNAENRLFFGINAQLTGRYKTPFGTIRIYVPDNGRTEISLLKVEKMTDIKQYRDPWLAEKFGEFIGFYNREFFCLDNFSSFGFVFGGKYYQTVEHAYQSLKFKTTAPDIEEEIAKCYSAYDAMRIAHENTDKQAPDWDDVKVIVMERLLRAKLKQNPYVKRKLMETGDLPICEDSPKDGFWGIGPDRNGRNELGKLWMKLRGELRK